MTRLRGWCACGGPLWRGPCLVCHLVALTSQRVSRLNGHPGDYWETWALWLDRFYADDDTSECTDDANSTDNTAATSHWLPTTWINNVRFVARRDLFYRDVHGTESAPSRIDDNRRYEITMELRGINPPRSDRPHVPYTVTDAADLIR